MQVFDETNSGVVNIKILKETLCKLGEPFTPEEWQKFSELANANPKGEIDFRAYVYNIFKK